MHGILVLFNREIINEKKYSKKRINLRVPSSEQILLRIEWYENSIHWWNMQIRYVLSHMHTREKIFKSLTKQWIALQIMDSGFHSFLVPPTIFTDLRYFYLTILLQLISHPTFLIILLSIISALVQKYSQTFPIIFHNRLK